MLEEERARSWRGERERERGEWEQKREALEKSLEEREREKGEWNEERGEQETRIQRDEEAKRRRGIGS